MSRFARDLHRKSWVVALAIALPCAVASAAGLGETAAHSDLSPTSGVLANPAADLALSDVQGAAGATGNERSVIGWLQGLMGARPERGALVERRVSSGGRDPASVLALEQGPPGLALLCESSPGGSLGFVRQCLLARLELDPLELPGYGQGVGLSAHWNPPGVGLDMSFGLGWLDSRQPQRLPGRQSAAPVGRGLMEFGTLGLNLPTQATAALSVQLDGRMNIGTDGWLSLGVQQLRGRNETVNLWGQIVPVFESESLRLASGFGDFSGALTGRVIELQGTPGSLNSLDLGLSWRTPWRGELTVGATQYWSRGDSSQWPLRELPSIVEESGGRVPYVRYHQDL